MGWDIDYGLGVVSFKASTKDEVIVDSDATDDEQERVQEVEVPHMGDLSVGGTRNLLYLVPYHMYFHDCMTDDNIRFKHESLYDWIYDSNLITLRLHDNSKKGSDPLRGHSDNTKNNQDSKDYMFHVFSKLIIYKLTKLATI